MQNDCAIPSAILFRLRQDSAHSQKNAATPPPSVHAPGAFRAIDARPVDADRGEQQDLKAGAPDDSDQDLDFENKQPEPAAEAMNDATESLA